MRQMGIDRGLQVAQSNRLQTHVRLVKVLDGGLDKHDFHGIPLPRESGYVASRDHCLLPIARCQSPAFLTPYRGCAMVLASPAHAVPFGVHWIYSLQLSLPEPSPLARGKTRQPCGYIHVDTRASDNDDRESEPQSWKQHRVRYTVRVWPLPR
jgi:hypothetical protein